MSNNTTFSVYNLPVEEAKDEVLADLNSGSVSLDISNLKITADAPKINFVDLSTGWATGSINFDPEFGQFSTSTSLTINNTSFTGPFGIQNRPQIGFYDFRIPNEFSSIIYNTDQNILDFTAQPTLYGVPLLSDNTEINNSETFNIQSAATGAQPRTYTGIGKYGATGCNWIVDSPVYGSGTGPFTQISSDNGSSFILRAWQDTWYILSNNGATFS